MYKRALGAITVGLAVSTVALAGCGGGSDSDTASNVEPSDAESIEVSGKEFAFDPEALSAEADEAFSVKFTNAGTIEHDFTIEGHDADVVAALPGKSASGTFTMAAGTYKYFCSIPGHKEAGMEGTLTVE